MKNNEIYTKFCEGFSCRHFIRFGDNHNLSLYIGRDDNGRYSFDFKGKYRPLKISSSDVIAVEQYRDGDLLTLRFSLENNDLLEYFCTFCQDLFDSVREITDDETAYQTLSSRYYAWKKLFRPDNARMSEAEAMGLIGELLFLKDYMIPKRGIDVALQCWTGPDKLHKDFSAQNDWFEVKTINYGKESVRISSLEQLESDIDGYLVVYELEKMSPSFDGININKIANEIIALLTNSFQRDVFIDKLQSYGFDISNENDITVFDLRAKHMYRVDNKDFPRMKREMLPNAIIKIQYELLLAEIESFKLA